MDLELNGKSVLITGGSKGIGRACAELFAQEGCLVHIAARSQGDLDAAAAAIRDQHDAQVTTHAHDLSDSRQVDALFEATRALHFGDHCHDRRGDGEQQFGPVKQGASLAMNDFGCRRPP